MRRILAALVLAFGLASLSGPALAAVCTPTPALPDAERRTEYAGIVAQTGPFNVGFQLYGDNTDYGNWLSIWVNGVFKTAVTDYTVTSPSGPLANLCRPISDAQVTFTAAQTGTIEIVGARRPRRASQVSENAGVTARNFNQVVSDMEAQLRESWDFTARTMRAPGGEVLATLPPAASRANGFLHFDSTGLIPQVLAGGAGSGNVTGPASSAIGNMAFWTNTIGTGIGDAPFQWAATGGPSGNGQFVITAPGGVVAVSNDLTSSANSITFGGTITAGKVVSLTFNYKNSGGAQRNITVSYTEIGGDTLATVTTKFETAFLAAMQAVPVSTDLAPFRLFDPGTVGIAGTTTLKFNFVYLPPLAANGTATLTVTNNSTAGSTTTVTYNGSAIGIGATSPAAGLAGGSLLTLDVVPEYATSRGVGSGWAGVANSNIFQWTGVSNDSAANAAYYGLITVAIKDPTAGATVGSITLATGNSTAQQGVLALQKGAWLTNGNGTLPVLIYPGAINPFTGGCADEGVHTFCVPGWGFFGNSVIGPNPTNTSMAIFGNSAINQTNGNHYAVGQDVTNTYINGESAIRFRIGNSNEPMSMDSAGVNLGTPGSLRAKISAAGNTSGTQIWQPAAAASGTITWPAGTVDFSATGGANQVVRQNSSGGAFTVSTLAPSDLSPNAIAKVKVQKFTASGTYTPSAGLISAIIECYGAGGGGGGAASVGGNASAGAGGGAGGYSRAYVTAATVGASQTVTVGAAGTAGAIGNNAGGNGGSTTVGSLCGGSGGTGGGGSGSGSSSTAGAGGVAGTGDVTGTGASGFPGAQYGTTFKYVPGVGASSPLGGGGATPTGNTTTNGTAATGFAAGGGGGGSFNGLGDATGGAGTAGIVIITEFTNQ